MPLNTASMHVSRGGACPARPFLFSVFSVLSVSSVNGACPDPVGVLNPLSSCREALHAE
jgi:hypothetical protein